MDLKDRIVNHEVEGEVKTCLLLGSDEFTVPRHMLQGEKMCGYIIKDGEATPWYWKASALLGALVTFTLPHSHFIRLLN